MSEENKAIVQRFYDALWNSSNPDAINDLMDDKCDGEICYPRPGGLLPSAEEAFSAANSALYADSSSYAASGNDRNPPGTREIDYEALDDLARR